MDNMIHCWGCGKEIHKTAATCPHCGADQNRAKSGKPWGTGRMAFYSIFSLIIPIAGLGAGIQGLLSSGKRKQGAWLLLLAAIGTAIYLSLLAGPRYVQPNQDFLQSELMVRPGIRDVGFSVGQFTELLKKAVMDNGNHPRIKGWSKDDNVYTLHLEMKQAVELQFTHVLAPPADGKVSVLAPVQGDTGTVPAMQFVLTVIAMVPEQAKPPLPGASSPTPKSSQVVAPPPTATAGATKDRDDVGKSGVCRGLDLSVTAENLECFGRRFEAADKELNALYKDILSRTDESERIKLRDSQRAWIREKEKECREKGPDEGGGGTIEATISAGCRVELTEKRVAFFKSYRP